MISHSPPAVLAYVSSFLFTEPYAALRDFRRTMQPILKARILQLGMARVYHRPDDHILYQGVAICKPKPPRSAITRRDFLFKKAKTCPLLRHFQPSYWLLRLAFISSY